MTTTNGRLRIPPTTKQDAAEAYRDWEAEQHLAMRPHLTPRAVGHARRDGEGLIRWVIVAIVGWVGVALLMWWMWPTK